MAHHKRKKPKHLRAGCDCKYWKDERMPKTSRMTAADKRRTQIGREERREA